MSESTAAPSTSVGAAPAPVAGAPTAPAPAAGLDIGAVADAPTAPAPVTADEPGTIFQYNKTGDAGLDMALGFVGGLGISPEHPGMVAAQKGDFSLLKAHFASLGDKAKGWEQYVALAEKSHNEGKSKADAKTAETLKLVHDTAGGPEAWNAIASWAKENAEPHERAEVNAALKAGGMQAQAMVAYLKGLHEGAAGTTVTPHEVVAPQAAPSKGNPGAALSAREYSAQVAQARQKLGYGFEASPEYRDLQRRREIGRAKGI